MGNSGRITDEEQIRSLMRSVRLWHHQIELAPGIVTPGVHNSRWGLERLDAVGLPGDCSRLRVLDIGCRDGFYAFEMERMKRETIAAGYKSFCDVCGQFLASLYLSNPGSKQFGRWFRALVKGV